MATFKKIPVAEEEGPGFLEIAQGTEVAVAAAILAVILFIVVIRGLLRARRRPPHHLHSGVPDGRAGRR